MFPESAKVRDWSKLPSDARKFIEDIEGELGVRVTLVGTGPDLDDVIDRR